jgi:hypothetical protein
MDLYAPFLQPDQLNPIGWSSFLQDFEGYRARGGRTPLTSLVSAQVVDLAALAESCTREEILVGDRLVRTVSTLFAPKTRQESRTRLATLQMAPVLSVENYSSYVMLWNQNERTIPDAVRPGPKARIDAFLAGLSSRPLREELSALEIDDPVELRRAGFRIVAELVEVQARVEKFQLPTSKATNPPRHVRKDAPPRRQDQEKKQPATAVRCYACNRMGHYASTCKFRVDRIDAAPAVCFGWTEILMY